MPEIRELVLFFEYLLDFFHRINASNQDGLRLLGIWLDYRERDVKIAIESEAQLLKSFRSISEATFKIPAKKQAWLTGVLHFANVIPDTHGLMINKVSTTPPDCL